MSVTSLETMERPVEAHSLARSHPLHTGPGTDLVFGVDVHPVEEYLAITLGHDDLGDGVFSKYSCKGANLSQHFFLSLQETTVNGEPCQPLRDLIRGKPETKMSRPFVLLFYIKEFSLVVTCGPTRDPKTHRHKLGSWPGVLPDVFFLRTVVRKAGSVIHLFTVQAPSHGH
jgi:hypothetical protein